MLFRIPFLCCFLSPILLAEDVTAVYPLSPLRSPITLPALHSYFYQKEGADVMIAIPKGCTLIGADSRKAKRGGAKTIIAEKNFSAPITMFGSYKGEPLIAILLEPGAQMIDCAPHIEIYGGSVKKMHSIVLQKGAKTEALSGKVINYAGSSVARNSYGFVLGDALVTPEDTVAFYNEETKDSTGFGIDWDTIDIAVANCNEIGSYGIYLGPNQKLPYEIGGRIYAGIQPSDYEFKGGSHAKAIYISESDAIGRITGEVGVSNQSGSRCIAYLLGPDFLDADNSLTLFNAQTGDSSGFDVDWDQVTLTSESRLGTCYGIYLAEGKSLPAEIGGTIQSHSLYGQSYGIWIPEDGALGCFGGHVSIRCSTERAYGYAKGVGQMPKGSSVGFFNISTKDSSGFNIDWKRVSISVSSGSKLSYGILLGWDEKLPQTLCGGGISSSSEGQAFGIYADNRYCIADLACPITVKGAVINACTYGYVLGKDVIGERDNVGLYNKYSNDSSQFGVDWSCFDLEVGNVHDSAIGIYLAEGENISEPLQGNLKVRGDKKVHGIYTHGALKGKVSGGLTLIENCSRHREGDAYGYVLGNQVVQPRDSVGFYNAVNKDSFGIKVDWKNFNLTVISDLKAARAIYLTGDYELGAPINGEITAVSYDGAQATALHYESRAPITLGINAKIMAAIKGESIENPVKDSYSRYHETAGLGTAIENTVQGIHLRCPYELDEPTIQITGNLIAGEREIYLEQGNYAVSADRIQASTLNLGRSKIVLNKPTSFEGVTTLRMDSVTDMFHPPIVNTSDAELDLSQVKDIYFSYFSTQGIELNCIVKGKVKWGEGMKVHVSYPEKGKMEVLTYPDDFESEKK